MGGSKRALHPYQPLRNRPDTNFQLALGARLPTDMFDMLGDCFGRAAQRSGHGLILQPEQRDYLHFSRRELIEVSNPADSAMCVGTLIQGQTSRAQNKLRRGHRRISPVVLVESEGGAGEGDNFPILEARRMRAGASSPRSESNRPLQQSLRKPIPVKFTVVLL